MLAHFIDPHVTDFDGHGCAVRSVQIIGPDRGGEAIFDRVYGLKHLRFVVPFKQPSTGRRVLPILLGMLPGIAIGASVLALLQPGWVKFGTYIVILPPHLNPSSRFAQAD